MKPFNAKAVYDSETDKLTNFTNGNYNNLSLKRKVDFQNLMKKLKKEIKNKSQSK